MDVVGRLCEPADPNDPVVDGQLGLFWHFVDGRSDRVSEWTELRFDTRLATQIVPERDEVKKLLLFVQPGQWNAQGSFCLGEIRYGD